VQLVDGETVRRWIDLEKLDAQADPGAKPDAGAANERFSTTTRRAPSSRTPVPFDLRKLIAAIITTVAMVVFITVVLAFVRSCGPRAARSADAPQQPAVFTPPQRRAKTVPAETKPERAGRLIPLVQPVKQVTKAYLRQAGMPDVSRPIDHESARMAAKAVPGVRTALWLDHDNFVVMVDGTQYRSMAMIDQVCVALEPLGDTLAVVVNVQDVTAQHADDATTLSRNCQLPEGQRAFFQRKRQVDVVAPEVRARFKDQQGGN
jgi:hypothetical protein